MVQKREKEKDSRYIQETSAFAAVTVCQICNIIYICNTNCYDMEVGENRVRVFDVTEKREGERLEIYTGGISPCSIDRVSDL
jgi:hypothetical protein